MPFITFIVDYSLQSHLSGLAVLASTPNNIPVTHRDSVKDIKGQRQAIHTWV